jgi:hypothetical protein
MLGVRPAGIEASVGPVCRGAPTRAGQDDPGDEGTGLYLWPPEVWPAVT